MTTTLLIAWLAVIIVSYKLSVFVLDKVGEL